LIIPIGDWVLRRACRQLAQWHEQGVESLSVAVNVSVQQFTMESFTDVVKEALAAAELEPRFLNLEVTESLMMVDVDRTVEKLVALKEMGVSISVDDFGTGFSSLGYLEDLPLDCLKIDQSFIRKLDSSEPQFSLVNTIIRMAESFGLETVAEGVETEAQLRKVLELGCDCIQGYLFSRPVESDEILMTIASIEGDEARVEVAI